MDMMDFLKMVAFPILKMILLLTLPFLFIGIINKVKALLAGEKGTGVLQPYYDFYQLFQKGGVVCESATGIFGLAPTINLACLIVAGLIVTVIYFEGDFILFAYLLALGKFVSILGAMDTGSSVEGISASREASYASFIEPAFFIIVASLYALNGSYSFASLGNIFKSQNHIMIFVALATVFALFLIILTESSKVRVIEPDKLDNSGTDVAFNQYSTGLKMMLYATVISMTVAPASFIGYVLVTLATAVLVGIVEALCAKFKIKHIIKYTFTLIVAALIVMTLVLLIMHGGNL